MADQPTRTSELYERVRADILAGRLVPGQRLKFPDFPQQYDTSVGASREVLVRLAAEGLVTSEARKGYMVTPLSHRDLAELTQARIEIESLVLRLSIRDGDTHFEAQAVAAHHMLERAPADALPAADAAFHQALLAGCTNRRLLGMALALRDEAELYRSWSAPLGQEPDRDIAAEHRLLLDHTVNRDPDAAVRHLREHIASTARLRISCAVDEPAASP